MRKVVFKTWTIPIALFIFILIGFGLLIGGMGFYQDDWYLVWMGHRFGPQIYLKFFAGSRPFLAGVYMLTTQLVGTSTLSWQIFGLLTRWLVVVAAWWAMRLLWPKHTREVTWIAILLAIYPAFKQHFVAVVYSNAYLALAAFFFSLGAMLLAIRRPRWKWPLTAAGIVAAIFSLVTTEYFFGLELFRPVFLWFILGESEKNWRARIKPLLINWAPYLAVTAIFLIWRVFFFSSYMYGPTMLEHLAESPLTAIFNILQTMIQDGLEASLFAWSQTFDFSRTVYPSLRQFLINWGSVALIAVLTAFYLLRLRVPPAGEPDDRARLEEDEFGRQAVFLGVYSALIVGWPFWFAGLQVELANGSDRFTLAYMFGAAVLVVGLLDLLVKNVTARIVLISVLVGAAGLFQFRNAQTYEYAHRVQKNLFRDLVWRAPGLAPDTKLLINDVPVDYTGNASMNAAMDWVYAPDRRGQGVQYRMFFLPFSLGSPDLPNLEPGAHTEGSLVASYFPPGCVQVIDPAVHQSLPRLTDEVNQAIPLSQIGRIEVDGTIAAANFRNLFGDAETQDWCYYFEQADLARQLGDWAEAARLGDEAFDQGLGPYDKFSSELLPFIEGYARLERWKDAYRLTEAAYKDIPALQASLCETWQRSVQNTPQSPERADLAEQTRQLLDCGEALSAGKQ